MKNKMMSGLAVAAVSATFVVLGASASNAADDCTPSEGNPASIGAWARASFTEWQVDPTAPADPDGQAGEANVANTVRIGAGEDRVVVDQPGREAIVTEATWQRYSWTGGPHTADTAPAFPSDDWQPNVKGDPHDVGAEGAYFRSHGNAGNGDWFYLERVPAEVEQVDPVTHVEHRWSVDTRTNAPATAAVACAPDTEEPPVDQPPVDQPPVDQPPVDQPPVDQPPVDQPPVDQPPVDQPPADQPAAAQATVAQAAAGQPTVTQGQLTGESLAPRSVPVARSGRVGAVPTVIDAGL